MRDPLSNDLPTPALVHRKALEREAGWNSAMPAEYSGARRPPNRSSGIYIFRVVHANVTSYFNDRRTKVTFEGSHVLLPPPPTRRILHTPHKSRFAFPLRIFLDLFVPAPFLATSAAFLPCILDDGGRHSVFPPSLLSINRSSINRGDRGRLIRIIDPLRSVAREILMDLLMGR